MAVEIDIRVLASAHADGAVVVDVREPDEYVAGHIPGAWLVPLGELSDRIDGLPRHRRVHLVCASGSRSLLAADWLSREGFDAVSVAGGTQAWQSAGYPVETGFPQTAE